MNIQRLVCPSHGVIDMVNTPLPDSLDEGHMLVRNTHGAEKHGTMESFVHKHGNSRGAWDAKRLMHTPGQGVGWDYPISLGNMQVGHIEKLGVGCADFKVGDRVVYYGGFAAYGVTCLGQVWKIKADTCWKAATCLDPATYAFTALRDANVRIGDSIAISSLGAIGLAAVALAKRAGCFPIVAIDPLAKRRDIALKLGADVVINPIGHDVGEELRKLTGWHGMDVIIEYSGSVPALNAALRGVAFGGTIACGAFPAPFQAGLDFGGEAHMNRPNLVFTRAESEPNRDYPRWDIARIRATCLRMLMEGGIDGDLIVTPVITFQPASLVSEYQRIMADKENAVKMGVSY